MADHKRKLTEFAAAEKHATEVRQLEKKLADRTIEVAGLKLRLKQEAEEVATLERKLALFDYLRDSAKPKTLKPVHFKSASGSASALLLCSDWHAEQIITPEQSGGKNEFNLNVAEVRVRNLWTNFLRLLDVERRLSKINEVVVWLGGDLINGALHGGDESHNAFAGEGPAMAWVRDRIVEGLTLIEKETKLPLRVVCNYGNHGRSTMKVQIANGYAKSWEWMGLTFIAKQYPRWNWNIPKAHEVVEIIQGHKVRFQHGDCIRGGGQGVGGVGIPIRRRLGRTNRHDKILLDVFAHFHSYEDGGDFLRNNCLCGFGQFASYTGCVYSPPSQTFVVIDRDRGKTLSKEIWVD